MSASGYLGDRSTWDAERDSKAFCCNLYELDYIKTDYYFFDENLFLINWLFLPTRPGRAST